MTCVLELRFLPLDKKSSISMKMGRSIEIIKKSGLKYNLGVMSAQVEGDWDELLALVDQCFKEYKEDCDHFFLDMAMTYRASRAKNT